MGHRERCNRESALGAKLERSPTGGQDRDRWAVGQQPGKLRREIEDVLEVVQDQQYSSAVENRLELVEQERMWRVIEAERFGDGQHNVIGFSQWGKVDEDHVLERAR